MLYLPPERSGISPHPQALCLWKPSSFLGRQAEGEEEVWIVEMIALIGWKTAWSEQAEAWGEDEEAWIVASPAHASSVGLQSG